MDFILISGDSNTGKTHVCQILRDILDHDPSFGKPALPKSRVTSEVLKHYEKNGKHIVLNSASDGDRYMGRLAKFIDSLGVRPDIVITTIRETGPLKGRMLALLEEAAKGTVGLAHYYSQNIANTTMFAHTTLGGQVSWVRLTKQTLSGNALAQYWNANANNAKQELDRIV